MRWPYRKLYESGSKRRAGQAQSHRANLHRLFRDQDGPRDRNEVFAEIDLEEYEAARNDPQVRALVAVADAHMVQLRRDGRIDS